MERAVLLGLIEEGLSIQGISQKSGFCKTTIRYWLKKYGVRTKNPYRGKRAERRYCVYCNNEIVTDAKRYCSLMCMQKHIRKGRFENIDLTGVIECDPRSLYLARKYLLDRRGNACEICGISQWRGQLAPLVVDHINGNPYDNRVVNLRLVCPNCDAQLPTYKSKNRGNGRKERRLGYSNSVGRIPAL